MIFRVWFKIFLIVFCVSVPMIWIQYVSQRESIELSLDLTDRLSPVQFVDSHLQLLKKISKLDPKNSDAYKKDFESALEVKFAKQDLSIVRDRLVSNLLKETLRNMGVVLGIFLVLSFFISMNLVLSFRKLMDEVQSQSTRLERLNSIESWQKIARVLVHELRAPITPIKLVATDIEQKYLMLSPEKFKFYLGEGAKLIQGQIQAVETLLASFTQFAKLPEVKRTSKSVVETLQSFVTLYSGYGNGQVSFQLIVQDLTRENILLDPEALKHLFFNLIKNAMEANAGLALQVVFELRQNEDKTWIQIKNNGKKVPEEISDKIFDLHVSTKKGIDNLNLGLGLTISKKIALDHQGDLYLHSNTEGEVIFELELPNV